MYYNQHDGREHMSPDVYVILDRRPPAPPSWKTWIEGKFPDIVFEIASPSTQKEDVSLAYKGKRALYARLGVREYYVYDPQEEMDPVFQGFESRDERLEPLPLLASKGIYSPLFGAELRPVVMGGSERRPAGRWLRVIDPTTGRPIPLAEEEHDSLQAAEQARREAEQARREAEQARRAEATRAERAEAESQELRVELARRQGTTGERS